MSKLTQSNIQHLFFEIGIYPERFCLDYHLNVRGGTFMSYWNLYMNDRELRAVCNVINTGFCGVYLVVSMLDPRVMYTGSTTDPIADRFLNGHLNSLKRGAHKNKNMQKYYNENNGKTINNIKGEAFACLPIKIYTHGSEKEIRDEEMRWIGILKNINHIRLLNIQTWSLGTEPKRIRPITVYNAETGIRLNTFKYLKDVEQFTKYKARSIRASLSKSGRIGNFFLSHDSKLRPDTVIKKTWEKCHVCMVDYYPFRESQKYCGEKCRRVAEQLFIKNKRNDKTTDAN